MVTIKKLNCGTTVIMEKSERVQSAALGIWVRAGASDEWDEVSGVSHFIEHMMFKGTKNRTAKQIAEDVDKIGGVFNAFTGKEATCYYIKTLSSNICRGAEILLDMLTGSKFDQEEMDRERQVICEEIKMVKDTPDDDVYDTISEVFWERRKVLRGSTGAGWWIIGIRCMPETVSWWRSPEILMRRRSRRSLKTD